MPDQVKTLTFGNGNPSRDFSVNVPEVVAQIIIGMYARAFPFDSYKVIYGGSVTLVAPDPNGHLSDMLSDYMGTTMGMEQGEWDAKMTDMCSGILMHLYGK